MISFAMFPHVEHKVLKRIYLGSNFHKGVLNMLTGLFTLLVQCKTMFNIC